MPHLTGSREPEPAAPGAIGGGALTAVAGIRAQMLAGAVPIAAVIILLAWRHRARPAR
jgi:hypothetical protein